MVGGDSKVEQRSVQLGAVTLAEAVIRQGLKPGERVVTSGALRLNPGATVSVVDPAAPAKEAPAAPTAARQGRRQAEAQVGGQSGGQSGPQAGARN